MKVLTIISILLCFSFSTNASSENYLVGTTELGAEFKISKSKWPIVFRCVHYGGPKSGEFMFSIRKKKGKPIGLENAWLIFPDLAGYSGELYRYGLDWRFDWTDRNTSSKFSVSIKSGGEGYYYNWSLADSDGTMKVTRSATCK